MTSEVDPYSSAVFSKIQREAEAIKGQVHLIDKMRQQRGRVFDTCMKQYKKYIQRENELLDRNIKHCETRNDWFREEVNKSWTTAVSNRQLVLRSVARTNVLKKDIDEWLRRVEQNEGEGSLRDSFERHSVGESLQGSRLIDKYNQILMEYGHRI